MAMAKYGPLSLRHGQPITSASTMAMTPPARHANSHGHPSVPIRMAAV